MVEPIRSGYDDVREVGGIEAESAFKVPPSVSKLGRLAGWATSTAIAALLVTGPLDMVRYGVADRRPPAADQATAASAIRANAPAPQAAGDLAAPDPTSATVVGPNHEEPSTGVRSSLRRVPIPSPSETRSSSGSAPADSAPAGSAPAATWPSGPGVPSRPPRIPSDATSTTGPVAANPALIQLVLQPIVDELSRSPSVASEVLGAARPS